MSFSLAIQVQESSVGGVERRDKDFWFTKNIFGEEKMITKGALAIWLVIGLIALELWKLDRIFNFL